MKNKIVAMMMIGMLAVSMTACGDSETTTEKPAVESAENQEEAKKEAKEEPADDGIIDFTCDSFNVKYVRHEFGTDYEGNKALLYYYTFTNTSDENATAGIASNVQCFQDGAECEMAIMNEMNDSMNNYAMNEVQPGGTVEVCQTYKLKSDTEITVEAEDMMSFDGKKDSQKITVE